MKILFKKKIKSRDLTLFSRKLATLISAGIPLVHALHAIATGYPKGPFVTLLQQIKKDLERGQAFSVALKKHPNYFNRLYTGLIEVGELSGSLDILLARLAENQEKTESLKKKLKTAVLYPAIIFFVAIVITIFLLMFIVPIFKEMFQTFNLELPFATRILLKISHILQNYSQWLIIFFTLSVFCFIKFYRKHRKLQNFIQIQLLRVPIFGSIIIKGQVASITRILATTETAGVPLSKALETLTSVTSNPVFIQAIHHIRRQLAQGNRLQVAIKSTGLFPMMVHQMIGIGEESGTLDTILEKLSNILDEELNTVLEQMTTFIEPVIMIFLGLVIGGLVMALYLPIFNMGSLF